MTTRSWPGLYPIRYPVLPPASALSYEYIQVLFRILRNAHKRIPEVQDLLMDSLLTGEFLQIFLQPSSSLPLLPCTSLLLPMPHAYSGKDLINDPAVLKPHP